MEPDDKWHARIAGPRLAVSVGDVRGAARFRSDANEKSHSPTARYPCRAVSSGSVAERPWQRRGAKHTTAREILQGSTDRYCSQYYCVASNCPYRFLHSTWAPSQGLFTMGFLGRLHVIAMTPHHNLAPEVDGRSK
jgi:hypothetical protein